MACHHPLAPAVRADAELIFDRGPQPNPPTARLGSHLWRAGVGRPRRPFCVPTRRSLDVRRLDRLARVAQEVQEHPLQCPWIAVHLRQALGNPRPLADVAHHPDPDPACADGRLEGLQGPAGQDAVRTLN